MTANQFRQKVIAEVVLLLTDSGTFEYVCPENFVAWFYLLDVQEQPSVIAANGQQIQILGERTVGVTMLGKAGAKINFKIMSVMRPILSVNRLTSQGYQIVSNKNSCIVKDKRMLKLFTYR